jgi:hypothetical protein
MQLARQIGEHLVAAELGRRGYIATPFAGNVPLFDLLVADKQGRSIPIQVKTIRTGAWQFNARTFLDIDIVDGEQTVRGKVALPNPDLVCILMLLKDDRNDEFFICRLRDLQDHFFRVYKGGRRVRNPESTHCAVLPKDMEMFRVGRTDETWELIGASLRDAARA